VSFLLELWVAGPAKVVSPATLAGVQASHAGSCAQAELWTSKATFRTVPQYCPGYLPCSSTASTVATAGAPKSTWIHSIPPRSMVAVLEAHQVFGHSPKAFLRVLCLTQ